ncbi:MAG: hypothetical protein JSR89_17060 [Proteobacteria bacterium]|nr:hypothetical protein [Pseudomonadota bacterium]
MSRSLTPSKPITGVVFVSAGLFFHEQAIALIFVACDDGEREIAERFACSFAFRVPITRCIRRAWIRARSPAKFPIGKRAAAFSVLVAIDFDICDSAVLSLPLRDAQSERQAGLSVC